MPRKKINKNIKHLITHDFILDLYKETKNMESSEKEKTVEKLKELVKSIGKELIIDLWVIRPLSLGKKYKKTVRI